MIKVASLTKRFNGFTAVDQISFEVSASEIFGFLGPTGAGKTTAIMMLTTLLKASGGWAKVCGFDISSEMREIRKTIGVVIDVFNGVSGSVNPEEVVAQNPDIIVKIVSTYTFDDDVTGYLVTDTAKIEEVREEIMNRPELVNVTAVKNGEVYVISAYLTGGGPDSGARNFLELAYFAKWFHPELFEDLDPQAIHQEYLTRFQGLDIDLNENGVFVYPPLN